MPVRFLLTPGSASGRWGPLWQWPRPSLPRRLSLRHRAERQRLRHPARERFADSRTGVLPDPPRTNTGAATQIE